MAAPKPQIERYGLPFQVLAAPRGRIVVGWQQTIYRFLADGRPDLGFGRHGRVAIAAPSEIQFEPQALAIDSRGRVLLAGTSSRENAPHDPGPPESPFSQLPGPTPTWATVTRLLSNGRPDPSFGDNGSVNTLFDKAPPAPRGPLAYPNTPLYTYVTPAVSATAIAVDAEDRPVIAGASVTEVGYCYPGLAHYVTRAYVARLGKDGSPSPGFTAATGSAQTADGLVPTPGGELVFQGWEGAECQRGGPENQPSLVTKIGPSGAPDLGFGSATVRFAEKPQLALGPKGQILLAASAEYPELAFEGQEQVAVRLRANGSLDMAFGNAGYAFAHFPIGYQINDAAIDANDRSLLVGGSPQANGRFRLLRLTRDGQPDRHFGANGYVATGLGRVTAGGASGANAKAVAVDSHDRIVVGGPVRASKPQSILGFGLVRYVGSR